MTAQIIREIDINKLLKNGKVELPFPHRSIPNTPITVRQKPQVRISV